MENKMKLNNNIAYCLAIIIGLPITNYQLYNVELTKFSI